MARDQAAVEALEDVRPVHRRRASRRSARPAPRRRRGRSSRGATSRTRSVTVAESLRDAIEAAARPSVRSPRRQSQAANRPPGRTPRVSAAGPTILSQLDMSKQLEKRTFERELLKYQGELNRLQRRADTWSGVDDSRVRRCGRRGQGRRDPARDGRARRARLPGHPDRRADRRRARASLPVAVLAASAARRPGDDLRSQLVRPRAGRARRVASRRRTSGCAPTPRSTSSKISSSITASSW